MIRDIYPAELKYNVRGGIGSALMQNILMPEEMLGHGDGFLRVTLEPGATIPLHKHEGEAEWYYVLSGEGVFSWSDKNDGPIKAGQIGVTSSEGWHGLKNTGDAPLEMIALVLYTGSYTP